jgi:enterochelin esterase-like enzyme/dienelactone hydrolase
MMRNWTKAIVAGLLLAPLAAAAQPAPNEGRTPTGPALKIESGLEYAPGLKLDLYHVAPSAAPLPVVIWIHGQEGVLTTRAASPAGALANANGYAVASIDYHDKAPRAQQLADVKAAIAFLRSNAATYGLDGAHIAVFGYDVGGQLAALAGTTADTPALNAGSGDSHVQAVIDVAGPITGLDPSTYVTATSAPTLIFHGSADKKVSTQQSQKLISALKVAGVDSQMEMPFAVGHGLGDLLSPVAMQTIGTFLNQHLKGVQVRGGLSAFVSTPAHVYVDPVALDLGGTQYGLYPTPSQGAGTVASYRIYLPPGYDSNAQKRYPVVYFLHGRSVDSKRPITAYYISRADAAIRSGVMPATIFVLVQGDNEGWYLDAQDGRKMESILIKDLIPYIDGHYRTIADRAHRAIEGHSMGGYGALHIGFKYPDLFSAVTGNAPAIVANTTDGVGDQAFWESQLPVTFAKQNLAKVKTQKIRIISGTKDSLFPIAQKMDADLTSLGVPHQFFPVLNSPHNHDQLVQYETFDTMAFYKTAFGK